MCGPCRRNASSTPVVRQRLRMQPHRVSMPPPIGAMYLSDNTVVSHHQPPPATTAEPGTGRWAQSSDQRGNEGEAIVARPGRGDPARPDNRYCGSGDRDRGQCEHRRAHRQHPTSCVRRGGRPAGTVQGASERFPSTGTRLACASAPRRCAPDGGVFFVGLGSRPGLACEPAAENRSQVVSEGFHTPLNDAASAGHPGFTHSAGRSRTGRAPGRERTRACDVTVEARTAGERYEPSSVCP